MNIIEILKDFYRKITKKDVDKLPVFYINGSQTLPPPLSAEEEMEVLSKMDEADSDSRQILVERNLRLVVYIAKKFENTGIDLEDLISIGTIGLMKAINTFNTGKNIKLATYASRCIDNEILMFLRKNKKRRGEISFEDNLSYDSEGNELHLEDILGTDSDIVTKGLEKEIEKKMLYNEIENLNERDKKIMVLRYGLFGTDEMTQKDVANLLGISQSYISRIEKKVIRKLKTLDKD